MDALGWAFRYGQIGWRVYPVEWGAKKAVFTGWQTNATTEPELIARNWRREPFPNVGLICGEHFAVFDIEGAHLASFFGYLDAEGRVMPETPVSSTDRGGLHIYVKPVPDISTTRGLRLGGVHIGEFKTTGGAVAPPSVTAGTYRWIWWPDDPTPAEAPGWLIDLITRPAPLAPNLRRSRSIDPAVALDRLACAVRDEKEGNRNAILFWAASRAAEDGIRSDIAAAVLCRAVLAAGLGQVEAQRTIESAFRRQLSVI